MNLIKQFMKIGGFKTPQELEAYGEEKFFTDFPEAKKLAMGGTPEAFPQIATADKFFSYGVPVPPTYYEQGGATGLPNIYPQIQSEQQFFAPVYTNSNNAYKAGGSYGEAFPQAVSYPQAGWGKTNYFMLAGGGSFPPGMPQYTGMLPVMQTGSGLSDLDMRINQDMNHYYSAYPMMAGGQPSLQEGGQGTENADQSFYVNKMQNFIGKLQKNGQKAMMNAIENVDEMPPMSGMRKGGIPKFQGDRSPSFFDARKFAPTPSTEIISNGLFVTERPDGSVVVYDDNSGTSSTYPTRDAYNEAYSGIMFYTPGEQANIMRQKMAQEATPAAAPTRGTTTNTKKNNRTSAGVSTDTLPSGVSTAPRSTEQLTAEVEAEKKAQGTATTQTTPAVTSTDWEGWRMVTLPDGRRVPVDAQNRVYWDTPYQSGPQYYNYGQPQQNYNSFLDYIPGGGLRRKSANLILAAAMANNDLSQYEIDPRSVVTRRALLPGNRLKSFDLVKKGTSSGPITSNVQTETAKTTQVPTIEDPNTFQSALPPMTTEEKVQRAFDWNFKSAQKSNEPTVPVIGPEGPVKSQAGPYNPDYSPMQSGTQSQSGITFDSTDPKQREIMLKSIMEGMKYGGPYALPMFQSDMFSGENPFEDSEDIGPITPRSGMLPTQQPSIIPFSKESSVLNNANNSKYDRVKAEFKRQGPFANLSADQMIAGMDTLAGIFNKYGNWNQENMDFNTAMQVYGKSNARNSKGSYLTNQPAIGLGFAINLPNANMRGMYAQYGGQGFYTGDNYYLTMPTIKNVKKAGAFKPGK